MIQQCNGSWGITYYMVDESGVGVELAIQLVSAVAHLIILGRHQEKCCRASEMRSRSGAWNNFQGTVRVSVVPFGMSTGPDILNEAISTALQSVSPLGIDITVLNAGRYQCSPALDTNLDVTLPDLMQINFALTVQLSQKLI